VRGEAGDVPNLRSYDQRGDEADTGDRGQQPGLGLSSRAVAAFLSASFISPLSDPITSRQESSESR